MTYLDTGLGRRVGLETKSIYIAKTKSIYIVKTKSIYIVKSKSKLSEPGNPLAVAEKVAALGAQNQTLIMY